MVAQLTIGKVAEQAGLNIQTVRYYERRGILSPDGHLDSGYRLYNDEAVKKLLFIKNAQNLGFSLEEIAGLLRLRVSHRARCADVKRKAETKLEDVHARLSRLRALETALKHLIRACRNQSTTDNCPILTSLETQRRGPWKRKAAKMPIMPGTRRSRLPFGISRLG